MRTSFSSPPHSGLSGNVQGALWMLGSALAFTAMGLLIKHAGTTLSSFQIAFFRCLFGALALLPFIGSFSFKAFKTKRPGLHALRLCVGISAMFCLFYAVTALPFATAVAISFARPLFLIILAVIVLKETVGLRRSLATVVGFIGVLIVMRPTADGFELALLAPLAAAFLIACAMTCVKILARDEPPITILLWFGIGSTVVSSIPAAMVWQWPDPWLLAGLLCMGALGSLGQYMAVKALSAGDVTAVAPFEYTQILFAGFTAYWVFSEVPHHGTFIGSVLIVGSAVYILWRESRRASSAP